MFKWLNSQGVESEEGFAVESMGRFEIEYREQDRKVNVYVERGLDEGKPCVIVSPTEFERWNGDPKFVTFPAEQRERMIKNFTEALEFQGLVVIVT